MKRNLILSFCSLFITTFLLVCTLFAWFTANSKVVAGNIVSGSAGDLMTLSIERGTYIGPSNATEYSDANWEWTETKGVSIQNMEPGQIFFFRFVFSNATARTINPKFLDYASLPANLGVHTHYDLVNKATEPFDSTKTYYTTTNGVDYVEATGITAFANNTNYYTKVEFVGVSEANYNSDTVITNDKVQVTEGGATKTLYNITTKGSTKEVNLVDYLIQDVVLFHTFGTTGPANAKVPTTGGIVFSNDAAMSSVGYAVQTSENDQYGYFALEFSDDLSSKNYIINGHSYMAAGDENSNLYANQILSIPRISLER